MSIVSLAQLNRATLARQGLLDRVAIADPVTAVERFAGLQAQEPASPYIALWSRLRKFDAAPLQEALHERRVIKASLMRGTLHLVSANDYLHFLPALLAGFRGRAMARGGGLLSEREADALSERALTFAAEVRSNVELRDHVAGLSAALPVEVLWPLIRWRTAFVHVPSGAAWGFGRRPSYMASASFLPDHRSVDTDDGLDRLVNRYLAAFGPASLPDIARWSGLTIARLRPAVQGIPGLRHFIDEIGRALVDLPDAPVPHPDTPAPVRFLPMWDSVLLDHADRRRVLPEAYRRVVIAKNGDVAPTFLVDGRVAGLWWTAAEGRSRIVLEPFEALSQRTGAVLEAEAEKLGAFLAASEPAVYSRYRGSRHRRPPGDSLPDGSRVAATDLERRR